MEMLEILILKERCFMSRILSALLILFIAIGVCGCCKNAKIPAKADESIVADINNYRLTVEDFKSEAVITMPNRYPAADWEKARTELLEEIIIKKILLGEAQAKNFDKEKTFMKEIERYWEQALLKLLIKRKTEELARRIVIDEGDVRKEYEAISRETGGKTESFEKVAPEIRKAIRRKKMQEGLDSWITNLRRNSTVKIHKKVLDKVRLDRRGAR